MGADGAAGMLTLKEGGAMTWAQNEESCVVFGMPREAIAVGAVHEVLPLDRIAARVLDHLGSASLVPGQANVRRAATSS